MALVIFLRLKMFKTIKSRMIIMQTITIFFILGILFVLFSAFAEDYYFSRKIGVIKQSLNTLQKRIYLLLHIKTGILFLMKNRS